MRMMNYELFGLTRKDNERIRDMVNTIMLHVNDTEELAEKLELKKKGEAGYIGYLYGRMIEKMRSSSLRELLR